ncbi:LysM peptidoglycan-binding domain-containing protein, partial [Pseudomonas sp. 2995-1]|uniref:LysM peptidoglycan-binding domain-containing protein n=1 Tax=Pseudomonas sp. 2995-1 TaxID=1712679 RepID=UPI000C36B1A9
TVVSGDTLWRIANQNGITVNQLKQSNQLNSDNLQIGQTLVIPRNNTTSSTPSPTPQQVVSINQEALEWLAKMIYAEARGEPLEGQIAVGAVIMNRVNSSLFPNSVKEVLFEKSSGVYQ